ncbi:MAG TPA: tetratricopeptide repeat protein [Flavitalea sp.]|nr:tetratricopeptide repeat protein [Flavitalea sp.]
MRLLTFPGILFCLLLILTQKSEPSSNTSSYLQQLQKRKASTISCAPDWKTFLVSSEAINSFGPLPGTGKHQWKISTTSDSAQFYFNQGMNLYYGFHIIEAIPSFKKAQLFDSTNAMLYWGEALAYGPNINDISYETAASGYDALAFAKKYSITASVKEQALMKAMEGRYSKDTSQKQVVRNTIYADNMKSLFKQYKNDPEIGALFADALMQLHPWDLWEHNGKPKPWTPEIIQVLEKTLQSDQDHPGANHYYIHVIEGSPYPSKANRSADQLGTITPGLAHMVHMPSHIYIRTGQYAKGALVNTTAIKQYEQYRGLMPNVANGFFLYEVHNRHMEANCSMQGNEYKKASEDALACRNSIDTGFLSMAPPFGAYLQYIYTMPELTRIHFQKWDEILYQPDTEERLVYAALLQHFAKGMAYANKGNNGAAKERLAEVDKLITNEVLTIPVVPFSPPKTAATVARNLLAGMIAERVGKFSLAINYYKAAVKYEDEMVYNEPEDWLLSARPFLGNALLKNKQFEEAQRVFREDLKDHPNNLESLKGLVAAKKVR